MHNPPPAAPRRPEIRPDPPSGASVPRVRPASERKGLRDFIQPQPQVVGAAASSEPDLPEPLSNSELRKNYHVMAPIGGGTFSDVYVRLLCL